MGTPSTIRRQTGTRSSRPGPKEKDADSGIEVRGARTQGEVDQAYELAARCFGPNYFQANESQDRVRALEPLEPLGSLEDAVVVVKAGEVAGFVRILDRQYYSQAGIVKAGGITSVCVHPGLRGQGWGLKVMEQALGRSRQRGDAFSILFARRNVDGWYPKLGYVGIGCHIEMQVEISPATGDLPNFPGSIQSGVVESFVDSYSAAYEDSYRDLLFGVYRDGGWWQNLQGRLAGRVDPQDFVNIMVGGRPIGYYILKAGRVIEAASLSQFRTDFIGGLVHSCAELDEGRLVLALPSGHWCMERLRGNNHTLNVRYSWDGGHMVRILDKEIFRNLVVHDNGTWSPEELDGLFQRHDLSEHEGARQLLLAIAGASADSISRQGVGTHAVLGGSLLPMLPTWSIMDGL